MRRRATATGLAVTLAFGLGLTGCGQGEEAGPAERMGKALDESMKETAESARSAAEEAARTAEEAAAAARKAAGDVAAGPGETVEEDYE